MFDVRIQNIVTSSTTSSSAFLSTSTTDTFCILFDFWLENIEKKMIEIEGLDLEQHIANEDGGRNLRG